MTCIHGLDEINCPDCRILKSTLPLKNISPKNLNFPNLNENALDKNKDLKSDFINEIMLKVNYKPANPVLRPNFINKIPHFQNELFLKIFNDLDIIKEDTHGITKKIPLDTPEWKFEKEE